MDRLTRPEIDTDQTAVRFMGTEVKIQDISDKLMHLILNGPTLNSINKDTLRHLVRQLCTELAAMKQELARVTAERDELLAYANGKVMAEITEIDGVPIATVRLLLRAVAMGEVVAKDTNVPAKKEE